MLWRFWAKMSLKCLTDFDPLQWPTLKLVHNMFTNGNEYQGAALKHFSKVIMKPHKDQALAEVH